MKITLKSSKENWLKEAMGIKPNTVRRLDDEDIIEIINVDTNEKLEAIITDITSFDNRVIFSFDKQTIRMTNPKRLKTK